MRNVLLLLAMAASAASPSLLAQTRDQSTEGMPGAPGTPVQSQAAQTSVEATRTHGKQASAFGQVMSVLTDLLQEAAGKEATTAPSAVSRTLSSDQSAVTITVTPVAGRSTFFVRKPGRDDAMPPSRSTATAIVAHAAPAQVAMQAEGVVPD